MPGYISSNLSTGRLPAHLLCKWVKSTHFFRSKKTVPKSHLSNPENMQIPFTPFRLSAWLGSPWSSRLQTQLYTQKTTTSTTLLQTTQPTTNITTISTTFLPATTNVAIPIPPSGVTGAVPTTRPNPYNYCPFLPIQTHCYFTAISFHSRIIEKNDFFFVGLQYIELIEFPNSSRWRPRFQKTQSVRMLGMVIANVTADTGNQVCNPILWTQSTFPNNLLLGCSFTELFYILHTPNFTS